ncbi:DUF4913 domain-containing protein [Streptomyces sp. NPDC050264]|uniref:DUF4913 domain-containing protein n=1 Tax=Streptomyces sp. NPDC050264 TaxID=3155038 RepID=UPI00341BA573
MADPAQENEPIRVPDHDLDDLVSTVTRLVTESRKQGEALARLTDEAPLAEAGGSDDSENPGVAGPGDASASAGPGDSQEGPTSIFILALDGTSYTEELAALTNWVHHLLVPVYGREVSTSHPWCRKWYEHPEAVARLHALWLAWQQLTDVEAGLTGPSTWHRDHLDPTLLQLRAPDGPFGACTTSSARPNHRLLAAPDVDLVA